MEIARIHVTKVFISEYIKQRLGWDSLFSSTFRSLFFPIPNPIVYWEPGAINMYFKLITLPINLYSENNLL